MIIAREYVINCFLKDGPIPDYFYEYSITLSVQQKRQIKKCLGSYFNKIEIKGLDVHFDGHNGDYLLYIRNNQEIIYRVGIVTHSDLFWLE